MTCLSRFAPGACAIVVALLASGAPASAYSVLTHEAIIDASWDDTIKPAIEARFTGVTAAALREARAYAYGGAIVQDMGYYPFGNKLFTDLAHYVRTGDFVAALLRDARDADEYAFALGALAHYAADTEGHRIGINRAEPMIYPKVAARYGPQVTYEQDPAAHLETEFGFDVVEAARKLYPTKAFHDFIGFQVAERLLDTAFFETYGLKVSDLFLSEKLAIASYRHAVSAVIPEMTKVAWESKQKEITRAQPGIARDQFVYNLTKAEYAREWGSDYERPGFFARLLSFALKAVPKVGRLRPLQFQVPPPAADDRFMQSFNATVASFHQHVTDVRSGQRRLPNRDFDTGKATAPGEYRLADRTYAKLLDRLARTRFATASPELRANLLDFYRDLNGPAASGDGGRDVRKTAKQVAHLKEITQTN